MIRIRPYSFRLAAVFVLCFFRLQASGNEVSLLFPKDSIQTSSPEEALAFLDTKKGLSQSPWWPNVNPELLLSNLRAFTVSPLKFYEGKNTNFCAYNALTYIPLTYDPRGFARFMIELYTNGRARMGNAMIKPGKAVRSEAGLLKYKGALDINPGAQMWYLSLADHFKGYINLFNRRFQKGDENRIWASTNLAKFNRMVKKLFSVKTESYGSDLVRPRIKDLYAFLHNKTKEGPVFLYLNNRLLVRKNHVKEFFSIPTHFILLLNTERASNGNINIIYWDYGNRTLQQLDESLLKKIVYGITAFGFSKED